MILLHIFFILAGPFAGFGGAWLAYRWRVEATQPPPDRPDRKFILAASCAGLAVALSAYAFAPPGTFVLSCLLGWTLLALAAIDLKHFILPDPLNLIAALLGLMMVWTTRSEAWTLHLLGGVAGFLVLFIVETSYRWLRGREGLGRGDAKLLGALGLWVGWTRLPDILLIASASGLIAVLLASLFAKDRDIADLPIAFGPWLAFAGWLAWLTGPLLVPAV